MAAFRHGIHLKPIAFTRCGGGGGGLIDGCDERDLM